MGIIGATKEEEEALRSAAINERDSENNRNSSQYSISTTDYESARSHVDSELEDETDADVTGNHTAIADNDDTHSVNTIQGNNLAAAADPESSEPQTQFTSAIVDPVEGVTNEQLYHPTTSDQESIAPEPVSLSRIKSIQSIARSHKSFNDEDSPYGYPQGEEPNYDQNASDAYHLALTRTLSRKTLSKKSIREEQEESEDEGVEASTLTWDGPDDKEDPKNWSHLKKWTITMVTASICLVVSLGSSLYVCGVPDLVVEFRISETLAISGLTFYLVGLAFGPVAAAPLSELFGRRIVYITSLPLSMLFTMGVGLSNNIHSVLILRFFAGLIASPAMAVAGGTIADIWDFEHMGLAMGGFCLAPFMGPVLGPIVGGFVAENKGWKWTMWVNLMFAGVILVPVLITPETYKPILLKNRAKKRGIKVAKPKGTIGDLIKFILFITLMTPLKMLIVEPIVMIFSIYIAFVFAVLFGFFEAYPIIFTGVYSMTLGTSGLTFIGVMVGFFLGTATYIAIDRLVFFPKNPDGTRGKRDEEGKLVIPAPETRLILCKIGSVALPISLFWLGWTSRHSVHWISAVMAGVPFGFGLILIFFATISYFSMTYPPLSLASALAANNFLRYILASVFPLFITQMYSKLHIDWATTLFAFIALAMVPVPWIFEKWGPTLRQKSVYGFAAMFKKAQEENERLEQLQNEAETELLQNEEDDQKVSNSSASYEHEFKQENVDRV